MNGEELFEQFVLIAGGLGLFLHGLSFGGKALRESLGERSRRFLTSLDTSRGLSFSLGLLLSLLTQSSTAATSMAVGLVDVELLPLTSAVIAMIGASVGTTLVILVLSLDVIRYSPLLLLGAVLLTRCRRRGLSRAGKVLMGFSLVLVGMLSLSRGVAPLSRTPLLRDILVTGADNPMAVILLAFVITSLIQSNVPVLALTIALASTGVLPLNTALAVIVGGHVGSSTTVFLAGVGTRLNARILARATFLYKLGGALLVLPLGEILLRGARAMAESPGEQVAWVQVLFSLLNAMVFLPLVSPLTALSRKISGKRAPGALGIPIYIVENSSSLPPLALSLLSREMIRLAGYLEELTFRCFRGGDNEERQRVEELRQGAKELASRCLEFLLAIPAPEGPSRLSREYASLSYSMAALRDLTRITTEGMTPICLAPGSPTAEPPRGESREEWERFLSILRELVQESLGALAVGGTGLAHRAQDSYLNYSSAERELRSHLLARASLGDSRAEQNAWDFLSAANSLARACLDLARGESLFAPPSGRSQQD